MKYKLALICTLASVFLIANQFGLWSTLLLLFLVGAVPGTSLSLSPQLMFVGFLVLMIVVALSFLSPLGQKNSKKASRSTPRRRFSRV